MRATRWLTLLTLCALAVSAPLVGQPPAAWQARMASSADPSGGNDDRGHYVRVTDGRAVLADLPGSGVITRFWTANPNGVLRVYLDGADEPAIVWDLAREAAPKGGAPQGREAEVSRLGGGLLWWPWLTYRLGARVEVEGAQQLYYQLNYVDGHDAERQAAARRDALAVKAGAYTSAATTVPARGETVIANRSGAGQVTGLRLRLTPDSLALRRALRLRLTWDGAPGPSVDIPLADLAQADLGQLQVAAARAWSPGTALDLAWPMPYQRSARLAIANTGAVPVTVNSELAAAPLDDALTTLGYFCATGHAATTVADQSHPLLKVSGTAGLYVGTSALMAGSSDVKFLEGDELFVADGQTVWAGTGTEDYFDSAWFFRDGAFGAAHAGAPLLLAGKSRVAAYRWHDAGDAIPFRQSLEATLEHGPVNDTAGARYRTVAYWYCPRPYVSDPMPAAQPLEPFTETMDGARIIEAESLDTAALQAGLLAEVVDDANLTYQASGGRAATYTGGGTVALPVPHTGVWEIGVRGVGTASLPDIELHPGRPAALGYARLDGGTVSLRPPTAAGSSIDFVWLREVAKVRDALEAEDLPHEGDWQVVTEAPAGLARAAALIGGAVATEPLPSGGGALEFRPAAAGAQASLTFEVPDDGEYGLSAAWLQGPDQGAADLSLDGRLLGRVDTALATPAVGARWGLGVHQLTAGRHTLTLRAASTAPLTLDYLLLKPASRGQEAEWLVPLDDTAADLILKERFGAEPRWSGGGYVSVRRTAGQAARFALFAPRAGRYEVRLVEAKVPDGVSYTATLAGRELGSLEGGAAGETLGQGLSGQVNLPRGRTELVLVPAADGLVALDVVELTYLGRTAGQTATLVGLPLLVLAAIVVALRRRRRP